MYVYTTVIVACKICLSIYLFIYELYTVYKIWDVKYQKYI
jgi:hypothetical protein